jgi:hypothetical protein
MESVLPATLPSRDPATLVSAPAFDVRARPK